jgi:hypothetical protein
MSGLPSVFVVGAVPRTQIEAKLAALAGTGIAP